MFKIKILLPQIKQVEVKKNSQVVEAAKKNDCRGKSHYFFQRSMAILILTMLQAMEKQDGKQKLKM